MLRVVAKNLYKKTVKTAAILIVAIGLLVLSIAKTNAAQITGRSVTIGSSKPSAITSHNFRFDIPSSSNVGSIEFEYCTNDPFVGTPCTAPAALDVSAAVLASQSGTAGFALDPATTPNRLVISRVPSGVIPGTAQYGFSNIHNPSASRETVYVRISTFDSVGGVGTRVDSGAAAFSTNADFATNGFVAPYLTFCVGITVAANCSFTNGNYINFGELNPLATKSATSQFAVATNDVSGYNVYLSGTTLTAGSFQIAPMNSSAPSSTGTSQYGLNLRANTTPTTGSEPSGAGTGIAASGYDTPNMFKFGSSDLIAASPLSSDFNTFTVSYIVNINKNQSPGQYSSTLTYVATVSF